MEPIVLSENVGGAWKHAAVIKNVELEIFLKGNQTSINGTFSSAIEPAFIFGKYFWEVNGRLTS